MRIGDPQLPSAGATGPLAALITALTKYLKTIQQQVNGNSDGSISAATSANTAPPPANTTTVYAAGDFIRNKAPSQQGSSGAQYVIIGWLCVSPGPPAVWVPCRCSTGS